MTHLFEGWGIAYIGIEAARSIQSPNCIGVTRPMSKRALANAERVADEAICTLSRLSDMFRIFVKQAEDTYPESFDAEHTLLDGIDEEVKRLRSELEGTP